MMSANSKSVMSCSIQDGSKRQGRCLNSFRTGNCESGISKPKQNLQWLSLKSKFQREHLYLSQISSSQQLSLQPQKNASHAELRKVIKAGFDAATEVSSFVNGQAKSSPSFGPKELKQVKASVSDGCARARERGKLLDEAIANLDNFIHNITSRKHIQSETVTRENRNNSFAKKNKNAKMENFRHNISGKRIQSEKATNENKNSSLAKLNENAKLENFKYNISGKRIRSETATSENRNSSLVKRNAKLKNFRHNISGKHIQSEITTSEKKNSSLAKRKENAKPENFKHNVSGKQIQSEIVTSENRNSSLAKRNENAKLENFTHNISGKRIRSEIATSENINSSLAKRKENAKLENFRHNISGKPIRSKIVTSENRNSSLAKRNENAKPENFRHNISGKRIRSEIATSEDRNCSLAKRNKKAGGAVLLKSPYPYLENQGNSKFEGLISDRANKRNKNLVTDKQVHASVLEEHLNCANAPRLSGTLEKRRMKRKYSELKTNISLTSVTNGALDAKCERTSSFKEKLEVNSDSQPRKNEIHHFRSTINGKNQAAEVRTSSLPVTQLLGKRSDKKACIAKRINSVVPTSNQVHNIRFREGSVYAAGKGGKPDSSGRSSKHHCGHQSKLQNEKICSIRLGVTNDLESKNEKTDITKNNASTEVKHKPTGSRSGKLIIPTKKSKFAPKEGSRDCTHRQVERRRDLLARMTSVCKDGDIMDITSNPNHLANLGTLSDKEKSKPSQFLTEKSSSDRDPLTQPMVPENSRSAELTGKMDDDYEELIAAIEDADNARSLACSTPFWKEMEPYFRIVTEDDLDGLKKQVKFACNEVQGHPSQNFSSHRKSLSIEDVEDNDLSSFNNQGDMQATRLSPGIEGTWLEKMMPLSERLLSALIVEDENEQGTMTGNDNGHNNFNYISEVSTHKNHSENYSVDKTFSRVEQEMAGLLQIDNCERLNSSNDSTSSNGYINYSSGVYIHSDKSGVECDILEGSDIDISKADSGNLKERHIVGWQRNQFGLQSGHQTNCVPSGIATHEIEYQQLSLDDKILLELNSIGLFPESVPGLDSEDGGDIEEELEKLKKELQEKVCKTEAQITHLEQAVSESWKLEERERERIAMNKLVLRASKRYLGPRGRGFRRRSTKMKVEQQANLDFVKRTLHRCKTFDETGRSCFKEAPLKQKFFREVSKETTRKSLENAIDGKSLVEGEKEKSFENKKMRTGMNDVKDGLQGFGSVKGRTKGKTKPNGRIAQLWMESNRLLGKSGELSKSSTTLINLEEKPSNKIVKETNKFTMGDVPVITQDIECESFVIDLSHLELPAVDYLEKYDMYDNVENLELFFEDDALQDAAADVPVEAVMTNQQNEN